jgi:hypothetical protein
MTGAEVGTFLGSGSTNGAVFDRSDPRTTTPQPPTIMKPVRTPWKESGPVFNGSVDSWVALANPVPCSANLRFTKTPDCFGPGISLDPRSSNFPCWRDRRRVRPAFRERGWLNVDDETCNMQSLFGHLPLSGAGRYRVKKAGFSACTQHRYRAAQPITLMTTKFALLATAMATQQQRAGDFPSIRAKRPSDPRHNCSAAEHE